MVACGGRDRGTFVGSVGLLWLLVVVAVLAPAALTASGALTAGSSSATSSASADAASTTPLGPPDWPGAPLAPEDVEGRTVVQDASSSPHSAIGSVGASGVLVSEYHVLTSAHVVTDDDGEPIDTDRLLFTAGLDVPPEGEPSVPYGRARVESIHVHPEWDGDPPEDDLALLVLDRPVGRYAGTMALDPAAVERADEHRLRQSGYVYNVTGHRQIASRPALDAARSDSAPGYLAYCAPLSRGDSGSPVWASVDGRPTVLAVNSDWDGGAGCADGAVGVAMDAERVATVERWMAGDDAPAARADLVVASEHAGPNWVRSDDVLPSRPVSPGEQFDLGTTVYNNGPAAVGAARFDTPSSAATVTFEARASVPNGTVTRTLCEDAVAVDAYDRAAARCTVDDLPAAFEDASELAVYATVDPEDRVAEYDDSPLAGAEGPQYVGRVDVGA